jgi:predicted nucleic acid-binding protein
MRAAERLRRDVTVPTVTLAALYRGAARSAELDAMLSREEPNGLRLRDTDRHFARLVGGVLAEARMGSEHLADAHAVAAAVEVGGGVLLTADHKDLARLAAPYRTIAVEPLT